MASTVVWQVVNLLELKERIAKCPLMFLLAEGTGRIKKLSKISAVFTFCIYSCVQRKPASQPASSLRPTTQINYLHHATPPHRRNGHRAAQFQTAGGARTQREGPGRYEH